jgi:hypothetical protein
MSSNPSLHHWLTATSLLLAKNSSEPASQIQSILLSRLTQCHEHLQLPLSVSSGSSLSDIELATAQAALVILEHIQAILTGETSRPSTIPDMGVRDLGNLRTLSSIVCRWGPQALLARMVAQWLPSTKSGLNELGGEGLSHDYPLLSSMVIRVLNLLLPTPEATLHPTVITDILVDRHLSDIWKPAIALAWLPRSLAVEETPPLTSAKPFVMRFLVM